MQELNADSIVFSNGNVIVYKEAGGGVIVKSAKNEKLWLRIRDGESFVGKSEPRELGLFFPDGTYAMTFGGVSSCGDQLILRLLEWSQ